MLGGCLKDLSWIRDRKFLIFAFTDAGSVIFLPETERLVLASSKRREPDLTRGKLSVIWAICNRLKPRKPPADMARMVPDPKQTPTEKLTPQDLWNDISLTRSGIDELLKQSQQTGDLKPVRAALDELQLKTSNYERLLEEMQAPLRAVLGKNFLGTAEWQKGFGVKVGAPPPIPESITLELLKSLCPLHPGELIKDTHILVLIPKTVDGKPYSALKLDELCASRKGSGDKLIYEGWSNWKKCDWAILPQVKSEWVLLPKSDPDRRKVPDDRHFRGKNIKQQEEVYKHYAAEYREAKALEVMTLALLYDVTFEERILPDFLRCEEPNASGGRVCVGNFAADGLGVVDGRGVSVNGSVGRALARKT